MTGRPLHRIRTNADTRHTAWIHSFEEGDDETEQDARSYLMPNVPADTKDPQHHYVPEPKPNAAKGRKYDLYRERRTPIATRPLPLVAPHWQSFTADVTPPRMPEVPGIIVDEEWQRVNEKNLDGPWNPAGMDNEDQGPKGFWLFSMDGQAAAMRRVHVC